MPDGPEIIVEQRRLEAECSRLRELGRFAFDQRHQLVVGRAAVNLRLAPTEPAQVRTIEYKHRRKTHDATAPISE